MNGDFRWIGDQQKNEKRPEMNDFSSVVALNWCVSSEESLAIDIDHTTDGEILSGFLQSPTSNTVAYNIDSVITGPRLP